MSETKSGRLAAKGATVTGGASGIGAATSRLFAREGASIVVADINGGLGQTVVRSIQEAVGTAEFLRADMGDHAEIRAMIEFAVSRVGGLDILINNPGAECTKNEVDTTEEEWDQVMNINIKGVFLATKYAVPQMKKNGGGSIVNISSAFDIVGSTGFAAYRASKGAMRTFTKGTAVAHARDGIRANSIHPGACDTALVREAINSTPDPKATEALLANGQPIGRFGLPEEIAYGCLYLSSDESKFVIGAELSIDGGYVAQ